jgi:putative ABC transport system permease protein
MKAQRDVRGAWVRSSYEVLLAAQLAWDSIRSHKLRSFLTLLGVIIGVASVIIVGAAIEGLGTFAEESTTKLLGSDSYIIAKIAQAGRFDRKQFFEKVRRNKEIGTNELDYLNEVAGETSYFSAYRNASSDVLRDGITLETVAIIGVNATMTEIKDIGLADGRFFTDQEDRLRRPVAVIGEEVRTTLFPDGSSPIGETIRFKGIEFTVIGVQEKLGSAFGNNQDKTIYIPVSVFNQFAGSARNMALYGRPKPETGIKLEEAVDLTRVALRNRFHTPIGTDDNFDILTPDAIIGFIGQLLAMVAAVVVPVTSISLIVGGIVIMNIMLVSVTERTREIGIRKSLGARQSDIMQQVLIESVILASVGGLLGVALGAALTQVVAKIFGAKMTITWVYVLLAVGVSSLVGIVSGWYPARRAARLDPIVALRSET